MVPLGQGEQVLDPGAVEKDPIGQDVQGARPVDENDPAAHMLTQAEDDVAPVEEVFVFEGHGMHEVAREKEVKLAKRHAVHGESPSAENVPGLHISKMGEERGGG